MTNIETKLAEARERTILHFQAKSLLTKDSIGQVFDAAVTVYREEIARLKSEAVETFQDVPGVLQWQREKIAKLNDDLGLAQNEIAVLRDILDSSLAAKDGEIARLKRAVEAIRNIKGLDPEKTPQGQDAQKSLIWPSYASGCNEILRIVNQIFDEELDEDDKTTNPEDPNHE